MSIKEVIDSCDLSEWLGIPRNGDCPFCQGHKKLTIYDSRYYCHKCSATGNLWTWLSEVEHLSKSEIIKVILKRDVQPSSYIANKERINLYHEALECYQIGLEDSEEAQEYLTNRGFTRQAQVQFKLGYSPYGDYLQTMGMSKIKLRRHDLITRPIPSNMEIFSRRIVFPIFDIEGNLRHLQGRAIDAEKDLKYLSTRDTSGNTAVNDFLFNESILRKGGDTLILTEGAPDSMSSQLLGFPSVGCLGLAKLIKHVNKIKRFKRVIALFDNDQNEKGEYKSWRLVLPQLALIQCMERKELLIETCMIPKNTKFKDVNDFLQNNGSPDQFKELIEKNTRPLTDHLTDAWLDDLSKHDRLIKVYSALGLNLEKVLEPRIKQAWPHLYKSPLLYYQAIGGF